MGPQTAIIYLAIEPGRKISVYPRAKTARRLLESLNLAEESALVVRDGQLLTPDRQIMPGEKILVRLVGSRG